MEQDILFLTMEKIHSTKKAQDYFVVRYILNKKCYEDFVTEETFKKIEIKKPEYLKQYKGVFMINGQDRKLILSDIR